MMIPPRRLADGKVLAAGDQIVAVVPLDNAERAELRFKAVGAGTLKFRYLRPNMSTEYDEFPADVAVLANDETVVNFGSLTGIAALKILYNTAGGTTVTYADWSATSHA